MKNLTPVEFRCQLGMCPAVYQLEDGRLAIIGKVVPEERAKDFDGLVGPGENVVLIDPAMIKGAVEDL